MKKFSFIFLFMLVLTCACLLASPVRAEAVDSGICGEQVTWTLDEDGTLTISGTGPMTDWEAWSESPWYNSTAIKEIVIEPGVTSVGAFSFILCKNVTSISLPEGLAVIGQHSFYSCSALMQLRIPDSVTTIGESAFSGCTSLETITLPQTSIDRGAFYRCNIKTLYLAQGIETVTSGLLKEIISNCPLEEVWIPDSVTEISNQAFSQCSMTAVHFGTGLERIGRDAFGSCTKLKELVIPDTVTEIGDDAFDNCYSLTTLKLGSSVKKLGAYALANCSALVHLQLSDSLTEIGDMVFYNCNKLSYNTYDSASYLGSSTNPYHTLVKANSSTTIHPDTAAIYDDAFRSASVTRIDIPAGIVCIGPYAFADCGKLEDVYIYCTPSRWCNIYGLEESALAKSSGRQKHFMDGDRELTKVVLDETVTQIPAFGFYYATNITEIMLPGSIVNIGESAFTYSGVTYSYYDTAEYLGTSANPYHTLIESNTATTIHPDTNIIGPDAFIRRAITNIVIPDNVTTICQGGFENCINLETVHLGANLHTIGDYAFYACTALTEITIPDNVTFIGSKAFSYCTGLTTAKIGRGPEFFSFTFTYCTNLSSVTIAPGVRNFGSAFIGCTNLKDVYIYDPSSWCNSYHGEIWDTVQRVHILDAQGKEVTDVVLDSSVQIIPEGAFTGSTMTSITISDSVKDIESNAFRNCTGLTELTIPDNVISVELGAFSGCSGVKTLTIPSAGVGPHVAAIFGREPYNGSYDIVSASEKEDPSAFTYYYPQGLREITVTGAPSTTYYSRQIAAGAFSNLHFVEKITLPETITQIGKYAFSNCLYLKTINIPTEVTQIGAEAFYGCKRLSSITMGNKVTKIGSKAFWECDIRNIYIPDTNFWCQINFADAYANPLSLGGNLYVNGQLLQELTVPGSIDKISDYAFYTARFLTDIVLEEGVEQVGAYAFSGCSKVARITLPSTLRSIGSRAFSSVSPDSVYIYDANNWCRVSFGDDYANPLLYCSYGHIMGQDGQELTRITLTTATQIPRYAFRHCMNLEGVTFAPNTRFIGYCAFLECTSLKDLTLPDTLYEIQDGAFTNCPGAESITIPDSLKVLGEGVFQNWTSLKSVVIAAEITTLPALTFCGCSALAEVSLPTELKYIEAFAFDGCALEAVTLPDSVLYMSSSSFGYCPNLKSFTIPQNLKLYSAGETNPFIGCTGLTQIQVDENNPNYSIDSTGALVSKADYTLLCVPGGFAGEYTLDFNIKVIGKEAFAYCDKLTYVSIPQGVTTIKNSAFKHCDRLAAIKLPQSVQKISANILYECKQFTTVFFAGTQHQALLLSLEAQENAPNDRFLEAKWHYDVAFREFAGQDCWYCSFCHRYYLYNGTEAKAKVTFLNWDGSVLWVYELPYGYWPNPNFTPTRPHPQPDVYQYAFAGWDRPLEYCTGHASYTAVYTEQYRDGWHQFEGLWYYYKNGATKTGWVQDGGKWYYMNAGGVMQTGWVQDGGKWYYMDRSGAMQTGWLQAGRTWYFLKSSGEMATGWCSVDGQWYYFSSGGMMETGWKNLGGRWYYLRNSGAMAIGWCKVESTYYYLNEQGIMQTGWVQDGGKWYYMDRGGAMQTGWKQIDSLWYFFQSSGAMKTGWLQQGSVWYYLNNNGAMVTDSVKLGGKIYRFNSSGICLNP